MNNNKHYTVAFCGLPSSGKSTMINSLIGERLLYSGVCRTTLEANNLDGLLITDDAGNKFTAIDLPGICDSEEMIGGKDNGFNEITEKYVQTANLVCFVSDVNKAFVTTHEVNEYLKIKNLAATIKAQTGRIVDVLVVLTKCEFERKSNPAPKQKQRQPPRKFSRIEISDSDEETDINDLIDGIEAKLKKASNGEDVKILWFNAFGRICNNPKSSPSLKKIIRNYPTLPNVNTEFVITNFCQNIKQKQSISYFEKFKYNIAQYIEKSLDLNIVIESFNNLNDKDQNDTLAHYSTIINNIKIFKLIETILASNPAKYNNQITACLFAEFRMSYYFYMLNNDMLSFEKNNIKNYTETIWNLISKDFGMIKYEIQQKIMINAIFKMNTFNNNAHATKFITACFKQFGGFNGNDFATNFDQHMKMYTTDQFNKFYEIITPFCNIKQIEIPQLDANYDKHNNKLIVSMINTYLKNLRLQIDDGLYIIYNKLQILNSLFNNHGLNQSFHFKEHRLKGATLLEKKIMNHPEYKKIHNAFYNKLIGDLIVPYEDNIGMNEIYDNITFLTIDEVLFRKPERVANLRKE